MRSVSAFMAAVLCAGAAQVAAGQTKAIREYTPAEKAVLDSYGKQMVVAKGLLRRGKASDALSQAMSAIAKLQTLKPMDVPGDYYIVAQCHLALGQQTQALADFKKCFVWDKVKQDLSPRVGDWAGCASDFAIALAQNGQVEDAKNVYYYALRNLNPYGDRSWEPYPFVVVFDTSEGGDVWHYSPERLKAASLMLKAIATGDGDDYLKWVDQAGNLAPGWMYPAAYRGFVHAGDHPENDFQRARGLAGSQEARSLIDRVASYNRDHMPPSAPNPTAVRAKLTILKTSKEMLAKSHGNLIEKD